jgi:hypothetical protein
MDHDIFQNSVKTIVGPKFLNDKNVYYILRVVKHVFVSDLPKCSGTE